MTENAPVDMMALLYGLSDVKTITLPSGRVATVKEMTGKEQRNFTDKVKVMNGTAINELLAACVDSLDEADLPSDYKAKMDLVTSLLSGDRQALLFNIRRESMGDDFNFKTKCPQCAVESEWEVNLSDVDSFPITPYPMGNERMVEYDSTVRPGLHIRFSLMDGVAEMKALKKRNSMDLLTDLELRNPQFLNNGVYTPILLNKVGDKLLAELRKTVREHEGFQDTSVKINCANCATEVSFDLLEQPDFMIPSVIS